MLEGLEPAHIIDGPKGFRPAIEFDGLQGEATTPGFTDQPNFDEFLADAGFDPAEIEIVGTPRTSRWQRYDGEWLTSYRFQFRKRTNADIDLPTLYAQAKRTKLAKPATKESGKALIIVPADLQVGKVGSRGGTKELIERMFASYALIEAQMKRGKYERIIIVDSGDIIEGIENAANFAQLTSNDLSPMQQTDCAAALMWDLLKIAAKYAPVTYASVGSNHCQFRVSKQHVGRPGVDDWGIVILQQLRRLAVETGMDATFLIPQPHDESLAFNVFEHVVGVAHGHQANRPDSIPNWFMKQAWGLQPLAAANILLTGHFHHTRIEELGQAPNGGSRWWVQASTSDNGSDWYRLNSGTDSSTGITCFELHSGQPFTGSVMKF